MSFPLLYVEIPVPRAMASGGDKVKRAKPSGLELLLASKGAACTPPRRRTHGELTIHLLLTFLIAMAKDQTEAT